MKRFTRPPFEASAAQRGGALGAKRKRNTPVYSEDWLTASTVLGLDNPFHPVREDLRHYLIQQKHAETVSEEGPTGSPDEFKSRDVLVNEKGILPGKLSLRPLGVPLIASLIFLVAIVWWVCTESFQNETRQAIREASESRATATPCW